jgi:hypothetical protein
MVRFDQDGIVFEDEDNIDQYEAKLLSTGELKIEYLPSGDVWTFNTDGSLDLSSISASAVDHDATSNRTHDGDDLSPDSLDVASSFVDASGISHTGALADDGDTQPPENHGNESHSSSFTTIETVEETTVITSEGFAPGFLG